MFKKIFCVVNPCSGRPTPILYTINEVLSAAGVEFLVGVTRPNNLDNLMKQADEFGADLIAIYGGDGTVAAVAHENLDSGRPIAIFPGGTANVLAIELGLPFDLKEACAIVVDPHSQIREVDIAQVNDDHCLTRVGWGFETKMIEEASREMKNAVGNLAYAVGAFKAMFQSQEVEYHLTIDNERIVAKGLACVVANCGNLGWNNVGLSPVEIDDGLLDIFVFRDGVMDSLFAAVSNVLINRDVHAIQHWRGVQVNVHCEPSTVMQYDGDIKGVADADIRLLARRVKIVVPSKLADE